MYLIVAPLRRFLLSFIPLGLLFATVIQAADRLESAALTSYRASEALLLDVTRVGSRVIAVGDQGVVIASDDGGQSWQQASTPFSVMLTALTFTSDSQGWVVGHDGLIARTDDAGQRWEKVLDGRAINRLRVARLEQLVIAAEAAVEAEPDNDELLDRLDSLSFQLEDAQIAEEDGPAIPLLDIWFADRETGFALGGYGILLRTDDAGQNWHFWGDRLPNPDSFHLNAMTRDHTGALYIAGEAGQIFRSDDDGDSWILLDSPYEGSFFSVAAFNERIYLAGLRGHLFTSRDGFDWQAVSLDTDKTLTAAVPLRNDLLILGQGGVLLQGQADQFSQVDSGVRRSFSAGVALSDRWLLVGERGVMTLPQAEQEAGNE